MQKKDVFKCFGFLSHHHITIIIYFFNCRSYAEREGCDYLFVVDADAHVDNPLTLIRLIEQNRWVKLNLNLNRNA